MSVYFIQAGRYIKVGYSQNPERRFRRLFASATAYTAPKDTPRDLASRRLLKTIDGDQNTEHLIHAALGDYCVTGEWYIDERELREWIASVETAPTYERLDRPDGNWCWIDDPILGMTDADHAALDRAMESMFAGRVIEESA